LSGHFFRGKLNLARYFVISHQNIVYTHIDRINVLIIIMYAECIIVVGDNVFKNNGIIAC